MDNYVVGTKVQMKKPHPCGENKFIIIRVGADFKLKCLKCDHYLMIKREVFMKKIKKVIEEE